MRAEDAKALDEAWGKVLEEYSLPYFHMVDCAHGNPPFDKLGNDCVEVEKKLIALIKAYTLEGFSVVAHGDYFDPTPEEPDVYSSCVSASLSALEMFLKGQRLEGGLAYFFETGHKNKGRAYNHVAAKIQRTGASLTFADKRQVRLLQAADLLAWQTTKYVKDKLFNKRAPRKDFTSLMEHPHMFMHVQHTNGLKSMGVEAWPLSRRSKQSVVMNADYDGPVPIFKEEGEDVPIIPVSGASGYRMGGGRLAYILLDAMGDKPFYLAFDNFRLREAVTCLMAAQALWRPDETGPPAKVSKLILRRDAGRNILTVKFPEEFALDFSVPSEALSELAATIAKLNGANGPSSESQS